MEDHNRMLEVKNQFKDCFSNKDTLHSLTPVELLDLELMCKQIARQSAEMRKEIVTEKRIRLGEQVNITDITLLSVEDVKKLQHLIPKIIEDWWLRSSDNHPGYPDLACCMSSEGCHPFSEFVYNRRVTVSNLLAVRPILIIDNMEAVGLKRNSNFILADQKWKVISENMAISDGYIGLSAFNQSVDSGNNYETSDVKRYLEDWAKEKGIVIHREHEEHGPDLE